MSFQSDLYTRLSGYAALTALVGQRIYPTLAPQHTARPYCATQVINRRRLYSHQGFSSLEEYRLQVSCVAGDPDAARDVATQVIAAMEGWRAANSTVQMCLHDGDLDDFDEEAKVYHVPVDFLIQYG